MPQIIGIDFHADGVSQLGYAIRKYSIAHKEWYEDVSDHTHPNDTSRGYLLQVDGLETPAQFYKCEIENLCAGANLTFSMWGMSSTKTPYWADANLMMIIESKAGTVLTQKPVTLENRKGYWEQIKLNFTLPPSESSLIFRIINNSGTNAGNDFMLDDIEIRLCTPPVTVTVEDTVCAGESTTLNGTFVNDGTFTEPLEYRWLYSATGDLTSSVIWTTVGTNSPTLQLPSATSTNSGFYRLAVASEGSIDFENCRAMSDPVQVVVKDCLSPCIAVYDTINISGCDSLVCNGKIYFSDTVVTNSLTSVTGCDTIVTLSIRVHHSVQQELTLHGTDSVTHNNVVYTVNTDMNEYLTTSFGCDSLVLLHIRIGDVVSEQSDTVDLIVNKYNWIVLCNNIKVRKLVPNYKRIHYQWYKDGVLLRNAIDDYYTEDKELEGCFFLKLQVTDNVQTHYFNSNTLCINKRELIISPTPVGTGEILIVDYPFTETEKNGLRVEIYNAVGIQVAIIQPEIYPIQIHRNFATGIYYLKIVMGGGNVVGEKLIVR